MNLLVRILPGIAALTLVLLGWEAACRGLHVPSYLLPPPSEVGMAHMRNAPVLFGSAAQTLRMALTALLVATVIGGGLAVCVSLNRHAERAIHPFAVALQVTPVVAIAPLALIWAGLDHADRAVIGLAAAVAFFPIFSGVLTGLKSADPDLERLFDLYRASPLQRLWRLRLPSSLPFALEGLRVASGLSIIGAVVAEFVSGSGATQGLAWRLLEAGNRLRTAELLAALLCLAIMGALLNGAVAIIGDRIVRRRLAR